MTSDNPKLLLIGNPTHLSGAFYRAFHEERGIYETVTMSALDSPNVRGGSIKIPGLVTAQWVAERRAIWREKSDLFRTRVLGEFPRRGVNSLIAMKDIQAAIYEPGSPESLAAPDSDPFGLFRRDLADPTGTVIGVDVARFGLDQSVVIVRRGDVVTEICDFDQLDTMAVSGEVIQSIRKHRPRLVNVDEVGVGSGVADRLSEQLVPAQGINGAAAPWRNADCANLRAEGYQALATRFRDRRIRIPHDTRLIAELAALRYYYNSSGKLLIESKDKMRARGLPSPDKADALMLAFLDDKPEEFLQR